MKGFNNSKIKRRHAQLEREDRNLARPKAIIEKGSLKPFKRASKLYTDIMNTRASLQHDLSALQLALSEFPPYVSRGHGGKHRTKNRLIGARWSQDRSKAYPNPGKSEAARRVFQRLSKRERAYVRSIEGEMME